MRLANIVPTPLLDCVPKNQHTHLVLSELILTDERYRNFYVAKRRSGDYLILDNPVHEDKPTTLDRWLEAVRILRPNVAVIPDVIDSAPATVANAAWAVDLFRKFDATDIELMAVPHGMSQYNWLICARALARFKQISWIGISLERRFGDDMYALTRRRERVQMLIDASDSFDRMKLHLLGISENCTELGEDKIWRRASSVDTSKFAVWCLAGTPVTPPVPTFEPYPGRFPFGGSYGYFFHDNVKVSHRTMRGNLRRWVAYAERELD